MSQSLIFTVFTKPWPTMSLPELAAHVRAMGYDGIELPVRPGFQVEPQAISRELPRAAAAMTDAGLAIRSVAAPADEPTIHACGDAGVPLIRIMVPIPPDRDYLGYIAEQQREWERLVPMLDDAGVTIGVQNHRHRFLTHAMHLYHALQPFDPKHVAAVWDAAHNALQGADPELALDVIWPHLRMVNLKNAAWRRGDAPGAEAAEWRADWVAGREGVCDWRRVASELIRRGYAGNVCLSAEYTDPDDVTRLAADDLRFAKSCFEKYAGK